MLSLVVSPLKSKKKQRDQNGGHRVLGATRPRWWERKLGAPKTPRLLSLHLCPQPLEGRRLAFFLSPRRGEALRSAWARRSLFFFGGLFFCFFWGGGGGGAFFGFLIQRLLGLSVEDPTTPLDTPSLRPGDCGRARVS